ncbi:hypothetical protein [Embleya sp. NPDC059237]|uniref:hypothetical protein n=1 Tax=Embleya sp. NPDC059237 TaxID=3346784 RepID=UPI0036CA119B
MRNTTSPRPTGPPKLPRARRPKAPPPGIDVPVTVWLAPTPAPTTASEPAAPVAHDPTRDLLPQWAHERLHRHVTTRAAAVTAVRVRPGDHTPLPRPAPGTRLLVIADLADLPGAGIRDDDGSRPEAPARTARIVRHLLARVPAAPGYTAYAAIAVPPQHAPDGRLIDRCGPAAREARLCDWRHLQHLIVVHAHLDTDRLVPHTPPAGHVDPHRHDVIHTDVLLFERTEYTP